jgi:hypothetical protein
MVMDNIHLAELINLNPQFVRSVNIERDFFAQNTIDNFLITRGGLSTFDQLARGVKDPAYRAQSISGPYGAGKSALIMQFAKLLSKEENIDNTVRKSAKAYLGEIGNQLLPSDHEGYIAILATGTRESLAACLLESLTNSLQKQGKQKLLNKLLKGKPIDFSTRAVVDVFEELASLAKKDGALGIIVIVDELGKLLEYAALHPDGSDIYLLQEMAEAASRSKEHPLWFITILHQEFSNYAFRLGKKHQQEWAKVQQRFFEIPCILDDIDSFQLISSAVNCDPKIVSNNKYIQAQIKLCAKLAPKGHEISFEKWALSSYPLHPTTLVLLPALFRRFGQGERSLFSFISANEIYSLRDWINGKILKRENPPHFRLPDLYDYAYHTLIAGKNNQYTMRAWTEVEDAIVRLGDGSKLEVDVLKCIGLLGFIGDSSYNTASKEYLYLALNSKDTTQAQLDEALKSLENKKLIVFRRFRNAFRLWEGSDIDINECLSDAFQALPLQSVALSVSVARDLCPSPPIIARKHSFRTGMLRYFSVKPCIKDNIITSRKNKDQFDGYVVHCLGVCLSNSLKNE